MTTADYLESLQDDLDRTVEALDLEEGTNFTDIADMSENGDISTSGGADLSEYYRNKIELIGGYSGTTLQCGGWIRLIKKIPYFFPKNEGSSALFTFKRLFQNCLVEEIDLTGIQDYVDTTMENMFNGCSYLKSVDLSNFNVSNITNIAGLFNNCSDIEFIDVRNFDFTTITTTTNAFSGVKTSCLIIVANDTQKQWFATNYSGLNNVQTVMEYEASLNE